MLALMLVANVVNIAADLGAMGDAVFVLIGGWPSAYVVLIAIGCAWLEIFSQYRRYVSILKWATLSLFAYVLVVLVVDVPWDVVLWRTLVPKLDWSRSYLLTIVAVLGTTISPYLFFWQSSQEAEDERVDPHARPLLKAPEQAPGEIMRIRIDTYVGMGLSNLVSFFITVTAAATLNAHGVTDVGTSAEAAEALRPIAGPFAFALFSLGIIGTGLLAVPVLAGSVAYALGESLKWRTGLARRPREAKAFYATIAAATLAGIAINLVDIDPIKALFWSAVANGLVSPPLLAMIMVIATDPKVMGPFALSGPLRAMGWLSTAAMAAAVLVLLASWVA
jgi:Mn2+/Fe2+ NRAMP family transporter